MPKLSKQVELFQISIPIYSNQKSVHYDNANLGIKFSIIITNASRQIELFQFSISIYSNTNCSLEKLDFKFRILHYNFLVNRVGKL